MLALNQNFAGEFSRVTAMTADSLISHQTAVTGSAEIVMQSL